MVLGNHFWRISEGFLENTMKKLFVLFLLIGCLSGSVFAFDIMSYPPPLSSGNILIDGGLGLGLGYKGHIRIPPLFAQAEYALPQLPISVGGGISFWQNSDSWAYNAGTVDRTYSFLAILGRGNWHWGFNVNWLDLYSGLSLGYRAFWDHYKSNSGAPTPPKNNYGGFYWGLQVGAHFYFTPKIGAMVEVGYPMMRAGVTVKL
jgi:hypothetical protein